MGQKWRRLLGINPQPVQLLRHPSLFSPSIVKEMHRDGAVSLLTTGRGIWAIWLRVLTFSAPLFLFCIMPSLLRLFPHLLLLSHFPAAATSSMGTCLISATVDLTQKRSAGKEQATPTRTISRSGILNLLEGFGLLSKCKRSGNWLIHCVTK